jgi:hypothetical protein
MLDVLQLLRERADPNMCDTGQPPLYLAFAVGNLNIATALLVHSADPSVHVTDEASAASRTLLAMFACDGVEEADAERLLRELNPAMRGALLQHLSDRRTRRVIQNELTPATAIRSPSLASSLPSSAISMQVSPAQRARFPGWPTAAEVQVASSPVESVPLLEAVDASDLAQVLQLLRRRLSPHSPVAGTTPMARAVVRVGLSPGSAALDVLAALLLHEEKPGQAQSVDLTLADEKSKALIDTLRGDSTDPGRTGDVLSWLSESMRKLVLQYLKDREAMAAIQRLVSAPT